MGKATINRGCGLFVSLLLIGCGDVTSDHPDGASSGEPDPIVVDLPIAFIERPLPIDEDGASVPDILLEPDSFNPGAKLVIKARAQASAPETDITSAAFAPVEEEPDEPAEEQPEEPSDAETNAKIVSRYDVKDLEVSSDGSKLLFAMRAPEIEDADEEEQPTWNIWEYNRHTETLRRVITSDIAAEQGHDVAPAYLPDGRIVFSSTRQRRTRAILLDENKPQYAGLTEDGQQEAFVLHTMDEYGEEITQLTFNQSHDLQPTVLSDGRVAFLRWDNVVSRDRVSIYTINPDGSALSLLYGYHSQDTGPEDSEAVFANPRELPDGRLLVILKRRESERWGGDLVAINTTESIENDRGIASLGGEGPAQEGPAQESQAALPVLLEGQVSAHGYFSGATPLFDGTGRMLVSWSQCRLIDPETGSPTFCSDELLANPAAVEADPLYSLWVYDSALETQLPVVLAEEGIMVTDPTVLAPRPAPVYQLPIDCNSDCEAAGIGAVHIRSVYDFGGSTVDDISISAMADPSQTPADSRPARFLRLVKPVSRPDNDLLEVNFNQARGFSGNQNMREILGYVPIEPDGSVKFKVPANVAFGISLVDANGRRIGGAFSELGERHYNWLSVRAGEILQCTGCHSSDSEVPHGRPDAEFSSLNSGAPFPNNQLRDAFGTPHSGPETGETMAEYSARVNPSEEPTGSPVNARTPSVDIQYTDQWTADVANAGDDISYLYSDIAAQFDATDPDAPQWTAPPQNCSSWNSLCRVVIHYPRHIQPLWEVSRLKANDAGVEQDYRCTSCHTALDDMDMAMEPAGQLELTRTSVASPNNNYMTSYVELLRGDNVLTVEDGALVDLLIETGEFETDEEGELILDADGEPIPILRPVPVGASMSAGGARSSNRFFRVFDPPAEPDATVDHTGLVSGAELKLIAEWLDIGGQYYNDPFVAPAD